MAGIRFSATEQRDLLIAWLALGVAFAVFFAGGGPGFLRVLSTGGLVAAAELVLVSLATAGLGFLLHELGHKVTAIKYDHVAEFRADFSMLFLAIMSAMIGFIFAAPGAVHHRGRNPSERENALIALAGPVVNVLLGVSFIPLLAVGMATGIQLVTTIGRYGLVVNLFLAAFNMIPFGGLDGRTVMSWNPVAWAVMFVPSALLAFVTIGFI
ncbi:MAG: metalloprotease [Haloferacaceae archaeon]